jgi:predicted transposase YdaD
VLIRTESPEYGEFLVLNEIQLRYKSNLPKRIRAYVALAEEKYNLPIYPILINILKDTEDDSAIVNRYESNFAGLYARQDYRVINLWEVDVKIVFEQPLPALLPFVPILKGGAEESTIQQALQQLRDNEQLNELETVLAFFASFVLDAEIVQQITRWDMAVLRESPWYQQILKEGEARGEARGEIQGECRGIISGIELDLEIKFGAEGLQLMPQISQISDLQQLKSIQRAVKTVNSLEQLQQLLVS